MKAESGEFVIETDHGIFDLLEISKDKKDLAVLSEIKEGLIREGKFPQAKTGKICLSSIAAYIIYISSVCEILDNENDSGVVH